MLLSLLVALPTLALAATTSTAHGVTTTKSVPKTVTTTGAPKVVTTVKPVTSIVSARTTVTKGVTTTIKGYTTVKTVTVTIPASTKKTTVTTVVKPATTPAKAATTAKVTTTAKAATTTPKAAAAATAAPTTPNLYPRLIVPVIAGQGAQGTQYFVTVSSTTKSDLLFDIAANSGYKTCTLVGRFPVGGSPTSSGAYGSAQVQAQLLASNINTATSAANQPAVKTNLGTQAAGTATNGANAVYASFPVTPGQSYSIVLSTVSGSIRLFEDYNAPVVGYTLNCV